MKRISKIALIATFGLSGLLQADTFWDGTTGDWSDASKWSNGVPGVTDNQARMRVGGTVTVQPGTVVDTLGVVDIRLSDTSNDPHATLIWNPGIGSAAQRVERIRYADEQTGPARATFDHRSGSIAVDADWFHVGRRGEGTYLGAGDSEIVAADRISIGEGANNHVTVAYAELNDDAILRTRRQATPLDPADPQGESGNESYIGVGNNAQATLIMNDNSIAESRQWRIGRDNTAQGTVILNNFAQFRVRQGEINVAQNGTGYLEANHNSEIIMGSLGGNSVIRLGNGGTGTGTMILNDNSAITTQNGTGANNHHFVVAQNASDNGTLIMNQNSSIVGTRNLWLAHQGTGTVTMNDNALINNNQNGGDAVRISQGNNGSGTVVMNNQSQILSRSFWWEKNSGNSGSANVTMNQSSRIDLLEHFIGGGGTSGHSFTLNDDSSLTAGHQFTVGARGGAPTVLTINDNAFVDVNSVGNQSYIGGPQANQASQGVVNINDNGSLYMHGPVRMGWNTSNSGVINQNSGSVRADAGIVVGNLGTATYNLDGGVLRANAISVGALGTFNWGSAVLTMTEEGANNNIVVTGDLTTGHAGNVNAASTLDLGDLYKDNGVKFDTLTVTGQLDLNSNADTLEFWDNIQHLRPAGGQVLTGEIRLVSSGTPMLGEFENIVGPDGGATFFRTWNPAEAATLGITGAGDLTRNRGAIVYRADGVYFAYNVSGQIPEPATGIFLLVGTALMRGISVLRRNQRMRSFLRGVA